MAMSNFLSPTTPLRLSHKPLLHSSPFSLNHHSLLTPTHLSNKPTNPIKPRRLLTIQSKGGDDSIDVPDRLISAVSIRVFKSFPFNGFLVFLTLYFGVVRNQNFSRYVRFNTMQVIVLDVLLIFPDLLERSFNPRDGVGLDVLMSLDSTVFLFLFVSLIYGSTSCLLGQVPRLPIVAEAADRQFLELN
ncbi:hypothetical protein M0R45_016450 [Rubus argutus]|uniref:Protein TIC 20 n=1 Tax=Rubus argutus TaxID=59490 RepID=A0AAW1XTY8_RUBAR